MDKQEWSAAFASTPQLLLCCCSLGSAWVRQGASAVKWGVDARTLFVGAADHNLRVYGVPTGDAMDAE